jgi:hypothetical protein
MPISSRERMRLEKENKLASGHRRQVHRAIVQTGIKFVNTMWVDEDDMSGLETR